MMYKTAIIDDGKTHSAMCSELYKRVTGRVPDITIALPMHDDGRLRTYDLCVAIEQSVKRGARIISLSAGSSDPQDAEPLEQAMLSVKSRNIIMVAAADNEGCLFSPACMPGVFGICADRLGLMDAWQHAHISTPVNGIEWVVGYHKNITDNITAFERSNSGATAVMAGIISKMFQKSKSITYDKVNKKLINTAQNIPAYEELSFITGNMSQANYEDTIVIGFDNAASLLCTQVFQLFQVNGYQSSMIQNEINTNLAAHCFSWQSLRLKGGLETFDNIQLVLSLSRPNVLCVVINEKTDAIFCDVWIGKNKPLSPKAEIRFLKSTICSPENIYEYIINTFV